MKHQISHSVQWSQRLRGYINLKTALALGAVALVGAFVVTLHAQDASVKDTGETLGEAKAQISGLSQLQLQNGSLKPGTPVAPKDQGPRGVVLAAAQENPEIGLGANLTGSFVDAKTNTVVNETLAVNNAPDRSLIKGETYHLSAVVISVGAPLYGLTIGNAVQGEKDDSYSTIQVAASNPVHTIRIESDISAENLLSQGERWMVATKPVTIQSKTIAAQEVTANGARVRGTMGGDFVDLSDDADMKNPFVTKSVDIFKLNDAEVGLIGGNYQLALTFGAPDAKSKIAFAALGAGNDSAQPILMADVDVPQDWLLVQGLVASQKLPDQGMSWIVGEKPYFEVPDVVKNRAQKTGINSVLPKRSDLRLTDGNSQENAVSIGTPPKPTRSQLVNPLMTFSKKVIIDEGRLDTCGGPKNVPSVDAQFGNVVNFSADSYGNEKERNYHEKVFGLNASWRTENLPPDFPFVGGITSFPKPPEQLQTVAAGHSEVVYAWTQTISTGSGTVEFFYPTKKIDVVVKIVNYGKPRDSFYFPKREVACGNGTEVTPGIDLSEDSDNDGSPDYLDPEPFNPKITGAVKPSTPLSP